jgi:hypothetical protein
VGVRGPAVIWRLGRVQLVALFAPRPVGLWSRGRRPEIIHKSKKIVFLSLLPAKLERLLSPQHGSLYVFNSFNQSIELTKTRISFLFDFLFFLFVFGYNLGLAPSCKQSRVEIRSHCLKQLLDCCLRLSNKMDKGKTNIQRDWEQREFIEDVTVNIKKVTEFLNRFGTSSSSTSSTIV